MKPETFLIRAKNLIKDEDHWCRGAFTRVEMGTNGRYIRQYCSVGALDEVESSSAPTDENLVNFAKAKQALSREMGENIAGFNDENTHGDVIAAFEATIKDLKRRSRK